VDTITGSSFPLSFVTVKGAIVFHGYPRQATIEQIIDVPFEILEEAAPNPKGREEALNYDRKGNLSFQQKKGSFADIYA